MLRKICSHTMDNSIDHIPNIYKNIIQANSNSYNISIDKIMDCLRQQCNNDCYYEGPIREPEELDINTIMIGYDNNYYIIKRSSENKKYWYKLLV